MVKDISALNYYSAGRAYIEAYVALGSDPRIPDAKTRLVLPTSALLSYGIETLLKAYLRHKGVSHSDLTKRDVRHALKTLYDRAQDEGLPALSGITTVIDHLDANHEKHHFRYMVDETLFTTFNPGPTQAALEDFHEQIRLELGYGPTPS